MAGNDGRLLFLRGQRVAALRCQESGLAMVNLYAKNVPAVF